MGAPGALGQVLRRELGSAAARLDRVLVRNVDALGATAMRRREVSRLKRFVPPERRQGQLLLSKGSWYQPGGIASASELVEAAFPVEEMAFEETEAGFAMLRRLQSRALAIENEGRGWNCSKPESVLLDIGALYRHRKHGYRGVIVQWFSACPASQEWVNEWGPFENGAEQPFYRTLVDTKDRPNPFMTLAAQENLEYLPYESEPIEHPKMADFFNDFEWGHHVLKPSMAEMFREDW